MTKDIVIVGAGGFGREVAWLIERANAAGGDWNLLGFVDDDPSADVGKWSVLGGTEWLATQEKPLSVVIAIGSSDVRATVAGSLCDSSVLEYPNLIDPGAICSDSVRLGKGNIVCAGTTMTIDISLGDFCIVNLDCTIGHDAVLNDFVTLYPSVNVSGCVELGRCVEMGTGSQIIQKQSVGERTVVGAGAVVTKSLPSGCTAVGIPAQPVKFRR